MRLAAHRLAVVVSLGARITATPSSAMARSTRPPARRGDDRAVPKAEAEFEAQAAMQVANERLRRSSLCCLVQTSPLWPRSIRRGGTPYASRRPNRQAARRRGKAPREPNSDGNADGTSGPARSRPRCHPGARDRRFSRRPAVASLAARISRAPNRPLVVARFGSDRGLCASRLAQGRRVARLYCRGRPRSPGAASGARSFRPASVGAAKGRGGYAWKFVTTTRGPSRSMRSWATARRRVSRLLRRLRRRSLPEGARTPATACSRPCENRPARSQRQCC